jgi:hypothetical protein
MHSLRESSVPFAWLVAVVWSLLMIVPVTAAADAGSDEWQLEAAVYLWGPSMEVTPKDGDSIKMSFSDILDNLDMTFMGMLVARKARWSLFGDVDYMKLSDSKRGSRTIDNQAVDSKVDVEMKAWIVTAAGGYTLVDSGKYSLDLLGGARYLSVDVPLKFQVGDESRKTTPSGDWLDGIVGVRGRVSLADKWYLNYYGDGGTGDSTSTWQALAGLNYQFRKFDASFGYRYLTWNNDGQIEDLTIKGPYAGLRFMF